MAFIGNRAPYMRAMAQRRQGGQGGMQPAPMQNRKGGFMQPVPQGNRKVGGMGDFLQRQSNQQQAMQPSREVAEPIARNQWGGQQQGGSQGKPWSKVRQQEQMAQRQIPPSPNYAQAQREQAMQQRGWTPNETNQILSGQQRQGRIADLMQQRGQAMQGLMGGAGDIYGQQMGGGGQMPPPPNYAQAVQQQAMQPSREVAEQMQWSGGRWRNPQQQLQQAPQGNRKGGGMQQAPQGNRKGG